MLKDKKLLKQQNIKTRHPLPLQRPPRLEGVVMKKGIKPIRKKPKKKVSKSMVEFIPTPSIYFKK